jgi:hypothetical protein
MKCQGAFDFDLAGDCPVGTTRGIRSSKQNVPSNHHSLRIPSTDPLQAMQTPPNRYRLLELFGSLKSVSFQNDFHAGHSSQIAALRKVTVQRQESRSIRRKFWETEGTGKMMTLDDPTNRTRGTLPTTAEFKFESKLRSGSRNIEYEHRPWY